MCLESEIHILALALFDPILFMMSYFCLRLLSIAVTKSNLGKERDYCILQLLSRSPSLREVKAVPQARQDRKHRPCRHSLLTCFMVYSACCFFKNTMQDQLLRAGNNPSGLGPPTLIPNKKKMLTHFCLQAYLEIFSQLSFSISK